MTKSEQFRLAIEKLNNQKMQLDKEIAYMSDMSNWCVVHTTKYMPLKRRDGSLYIPSTAMATDFDIPRGTVHVTLNHIVKPVAMGNDWDNMPIVVLMPYNEVVKQNGNPAEVAGTDTYWSVNPDTGLVLPKSAYIIQPDNNGPLYKIGKDGATYKRDNYTDEEIKMIESMLSPDDKADYDKFASGDISEYDNDVRKSVLFTEDERITKMYESSKDKKAFLRGVFEEARFDMLTRYLRKAVTRMAMEKIGYHYVDNLNDADVTCKAIAATAEAQNVLPANESNKGHSGSIYSKMENVYTRIYWCLHGYEPSHVPGILDTPDFAELYDAFEKHDDAPIMDAVITSIVENKPIDFLQVYQDVYVEESEFKINKWRKLMKESKEGLERQTQGLKEGDEIEYNREKQIKLHQEYMEKAGKYLKYWDGKTTIAKFDKNLDKTIRRHCKKLNAEFEAWRDALSKKTGYDKFIESLRSNFYGDNKAKNWYAQSGREM